MHKNTYVILGYERSGKESEKHLLSLGYTVLVHDDYQQKTPTIEWDKVLAIIQTPGIPPSHPIALVAKQNNIPIYTDINLLQKRSPQSKYIGITGTNGKSTTTALIGHILKEAGIKTAIGGNIGIPALALEELDEKGWYVLELSSYQLELSHTLALDIAVWTNISPDHLERHGTIENYIEAKERIFTNAKYACIAIDDEYSEHISHQQQISHTTVASEMIKPLANIYVDDKGILHHKELTFDCTTLQHLKGRHNWQNVALAFAATLHILKDPQKTWQHIKTFPGLSHRQQSIATIDSVEFVNDSKATNANACEKALKTYLGKNIFWILGGIPKTDGIHSLAPYFSYIKKAYLIGEAQEYFAKTLENLIPFEKSYTLEKAVNQAYIDARKARDAIVLLSPACASFDQFRDYEQRGEVFIDLVKGLNS